MAWDRDRRRATRRLLTTQPATTPQALAAPEPVAFEIVSPAQPPAEPPAVQALPDDETVLADLDRWLDQTASDVHQPRPDRRDPQSWDGRSDGGDAA
jgi:hypothetical protein